MGDPTCKETSRNTAGPDIAWVDFSNARFCEKTTAVAVNEPKTSRNPRKEESIESSAGTEALTDVSNGDEVDCSLSSVLPSVVDGNPEELADAGSPLQNGSLHSFFSALFDETASKLEELDDSWKEEKEENRPFEVAESTHAQAEQVEQKKCETSYNQLEDVVGDNSISQLSLDVNDGNNDQEKHAEQINTYSNRSEQEIVHEGHSINQLSLDLNGDKNKQEAQIEQQQPNANRNDQESVALIHSKSQASLELNDVFGSSSICALEGGVSSSNIDQSEILGSSREEQSRQNLRKGSDSQDEAQQLITAKEKRALRNRCHSSAADTNREWNSFHGDISGSSKQSKTSSGKQSNEVIKSSSSHGKSLRSKLAKHASISSFFSHDKRSFKPNSSKAAVCNEDMDHATRRLDTNSDGIPDDDTKVQALAKNDLSLSLAFGMDDTDRISNLLDRKQSTSIRGKESAKNAEALSHRRDELKESIRRSLHSGEEARKDYPNEDLLANSSHSQASYFGKLKPPKRVTAAAESIFKLASKAKETAKVGAKLATTTATKTAKATVLAPAYAASYVANLKGKNHSSDPPADDSNVDPVPRQPQQHEERNGCEQRSTKESRIDDLRARKSTPHRQRSSSIDSRSRKRPSNRERSSDDSSARRITSRNSSDNDKSRRRSKSRPSSRHRSNEEKSVISQPPTRSRSIRRQREDGSESSHSNRNRIGEEKSASLHRSRSRSSRRHREDDAKSEHSNNVDSSRCRSRDEHLRSRSRNRNSDEKSATSRSHHREKSDDRDKVSQRRSRSRRRADDSGSAVSSRSRTSRSVSRQRARNIDENSTHRTRRRGRSLRRSDPPGDPPGLASDYNEKKECENQTDPEPQVRGYRCRSKSNGPRRKRRTSIPKD